MNYELAWKGLKQMIQNLLISYGTVFAQDDPDPKIVAVANGYQEVSDLMEIIEDMFQLEDE